MSRRFGVIVVATVAIICLSASSAASLRQIGGSGHNCQEGSPELGVVVTPYGTPIQVVNAERIDSRLLGLDVVSVCTTHYAVIGFADVFVVIAPGANVSWGPSELRSTPLWQVPISPTFSTIGDDACFLAGSFDLDYLLTTDGQLVPLVC